MAKLVEADCLNVVALMGSVISTQQIDRLIWMHEKVEFPRILLFLDRDTAGKTGSHQIRQRLSARGLSVSVFDWDQLVALNGQEAGPIPESIQDPADMTTEQVRTLRRQEIL